MYTRSYDVNEKERIRIPENYDGTAFSQVSETKDEKTEPTAKEPAQIHTQEATPTMKIPEKSFSGDIYKGGHKDERGGFFGSDLLKKIPFLGFGGEHRLGDLLPKKLGGEEILIIAVAAFLIFTGSADIESVIMIFLLLLIK